MNMRPPSRPLTAIVLAAACLGLAGCSSAREAFGLTKQPPDEFSVVTRAPLSIPPDFTLRPPRPGAARPQEQSIQAQAREVLIPETQSASAAAGDLSRGESALLSEAGAINVDGSIRQRVDRESSAIAKENVRFVDRLIFWRDAPQPGDVIDPEAEARRLQTNAALGKPVTEGNKVVIERKQRGLFDGVF